MKRFFSILSFVAVLSFGAGCTVYDTADVEDSTGVSLQEGIFDRVMTPFCRIVDLTDFYYRYRSIMGNEEAVESLKNMYFGETVSMESFGENDGIEVDYWGQIELNGSGKEYFAKVSPYWTGLDPSYSISVTAGRGYHILYNYSDNVNMTVEKGGYNVSLEGDVEVEGYHVAVNSLSIEYNETSLARPLKIRVAAGSGDDTVMMNLCQSGEYTVYPVAGVLYYSVSGYITDSFKVVFYGDHFDVESTEL